MDLRDKPTNYNLISWSNGIKEEIINLFVWFAFY